jgi:hypothetical protein
MSKDSMWRGIWKILQNFLQTKPALGCIEDEYRVPLVRIVLAVFFFEKKTKPMGVFLFLVQIWNKF